MPKPSPKAAEAGSEGVTDAATVEFFPVGAVPAEPGEPPAPASPKRKPRAPAARKKEAESVQRRIEAQRAALALAASDPATSLPANTKTEKAQMAHFRSLLVQESGDAIVRKILAKALNDNDPDQMQALRFCADRLLPLEQFASKGVGSAPRISIHIDTADGTGGILQEQAHRRRQATIDVEAVEIPEPSDDDE